MTLNPLKSICPTSRSEDVERVDTADFESEGLARALCACAKGFIACVFGMGWFPQWRFPGSEVSA